jgi:glycosyltransferase involved in cell wall biosynthesis
MSSNRQNIILSHIGTQHSHRIVFALQQVARLHSFFTGYYYKQGFISTIIQRIKPGLHQSLLSVRSFPGLSDSTIRIFPIFDILKVLTWKTLGLTQFAISFVRQFDTYYDRLLSQFYVPKTPCVWIGYVNCSLSTFQTVKKRGGIAILDMPTLHHRTIKKILEAEKVLAPEFAASLTDVFIPELYPRLEAEFEEATYITVPSEFVRQSLVENGIAPEKIVKIPYGTHLTPIDPSTIKPYQAGTTLELVFVGQIQQKKGIKYILEAVKNLRERGCDVRLRLVGKPFDCQEALQHYNGHYELVPFMPREQLRELFLNAHILVSPSLIEGSSLTIMEAMAVGLLPIVSEHCGAEAVDSGRNGYLVPIRSSAIFETHITDLLSNPAKIAAMRVAAVQTIQNEFRWENYYTRWQQFVDGLPL